MDKNQDPGSGVNIPDSQHWLKKRSEDYTLSLERYRMLQLLKPTYRGYEPVPIVFVLHGSQGTIYYFVVNQSFENIVDLAQDCTIYRQRYVM